LKALPQDKLRKVELTFGHATLDKASLQAVYHDMQTVLDSFWKTYFVALEVSPSGHVHCHAIVCGAYVGQKVLSAKADEVMGRPVVWISRNAKVAYLIKDCAKVPEFESEDLRIRYFLATRGVRMYRSRGLLYGIGKKGDGSELRGGHLCPKCGGDMVFNGYSYREVVSVPPPEREIASWVSDMLLASGVCP
jgi:hypothetical protein